MTQQNETGATKESAKKVDARDANQSRSNPTDPHAPAQRSEHQGAHADRNKPPSDHAVRGFDAPDHEVKEDLHRSVRKG